MKEIYKKSISFLFENNSHKQTVVKNTIWMMIAEGLSKLFLFAITVIITRYLGTENYGKFSYAFTFVALFGVMTDAGLNTLIIREISRNVRVARKYIDNLLVIKAIFSIFTLTLIFFAIQILQKDSDVRILVYLTSIYAVIQGYIIFFQSIFQGYQKMQYTFLSKTTYVIVLLISVLFLITNKSGTFVLIGGYILTSILTLFILLVVTRKYISRFFFEFDFIFWKKIINEAWPFLAGMICIVIYVNADSLIIASFRDFKEVGLYQAAYKIFFAFQSINLIHQVLYPKLSDLHGQRAMEKFNKLTKTLINYSLVLLIPFGILTTIFSKQILHIIYGSEFVTANIALSFLIWTGILIHFSTFYSNKLIILNGQKGWFYAALAGAISNIGLNLLLIPSYGFVAASITTLLSEIVVFILIIYQLGRTKIDEI